MAHVAQRMRHADIRRQTFGLYHVRSVVWPDKPNTVSPPELLTI
jgi:hypothetical protein